jgi:hypothetical protein
MLPVSIPLKARHPLVSPNKQHSTSKISSSKPLLATTMSSSGEPSSKRAKNDGKADLVEEAKK